MTSQDTYLCRFCPYKNNVIEPTLIVFPQQPGFSTVDWHNLECLYRQTPQNYSSPLVKILKAPLFDWLPNCPNRFTDYVREHPEWRKYFPEQFPNHEYICDYVADAESSTDLENPTQPESMDEIMFLRMRARRPVVPFDVFAQILLHLEPDKWSSGSIRTLPAWFEESPEVNVEEMNVISHMEPHHLARFAQETRARGWRFKSVVFNRIDPVSLAHLSSCFQEIVVKEDWKPGNGFFLDDFIDSYVALNGQVREIECRIMVGNRQPTNWYHRPFRKEQKRLKLRQVFQKDWLLADGDPLVFMHEDSSSTEARLSEAWSISSTSRTTCLKIKNPSGNTCGIRVLESIASHSELGQVVQELEASSFRYTFSFIFLEAKFPKFDSDFDPNFLERAYVSPAHIGLFTAFEGIPLTLCISEMTLANYPDVHNSQITGLDLIVSDQLDDQFESHRAFMDYLLHQPQLSSILLRNYSSAPRFDFGPSIDEAFFKVLPHLINLESYGMHPQRGMNPKIIDYLNERRFRRLTLVFLCLEIVHEYTYGWI